MFTMIYYMLRLALKFTYRLMSFLLKILLIPVEIIFWAFRFLVF